MIVSGNTEPGPAGDPAGEPLQRARAESAETPPVDRVAASFEPVPFDSDRWHIEAAENRVEEHLGRTSLYLKDGIAWVEEVEIGDGVVEVDVAFADERGFMGALWRLEDATNYEHFYLRPHQAGNPDANQYTPVYDGLSSWQLYHGAGYGAPVEYRYEAWNKVRIVVSGGQAEVFINDMERPALFIPELKRPLGAGKIGITAYFAPAHFSEFRFRAGQPPAFRSAPPSERRAAEGTVSTWEVSDAFDWASVRDQTELPRAFVEARSWEKLSSEDSGLVNLASIRARGDGKNTVFARVILDSDREQLVRVRFGYSDLVRVYLNGRALYAGDNRYRSRDYRYLGTIGFFDEVFLPLRDGENQLWFAVAEDFGGWGLEAIVERSAGLAVRP